MTITPIGGGVDVPAYVADTAGNKQNAIVVVPVNADGTPTGGGGGSSTSPTIVGGEYNSTLPALTNGQTDAIQFTPTGEVRVQVVAWAAAATDGTSNSLAFVGSGAGNAATSRNILATAGFVHNGATWDRMRGDTTGTYMVLKGSSTLSANQATATTTAAQVIAARAGRSRVTITNLGTTDVFIGPTGVTTTTGQILVGTKGASITLNTSAAIFAIVGTGTQAVSFIEEY